MGSRYVYKVFRKIKILKYCKRWLNHIYRTELLVCQLYTGWSARYLIIEQNTP